MVLKRLNASGKDASRGRKVAWLLSFVLIVSGIALLGCTQVQPGGSASVQATIQPSATGLPSSTPSVVASASATAEFVSVRVSVEGIEKQVNREVVVAKGSSVLDALKQSASVDLIQYPFGAYVRGVNGILENEKGNGKYWQYYVDGKLGPVAIDAYALQNSGVTIAMRYEIPDANAMGELNPSGVATVAAK